MTYLLSEIDKETAVTFIHRYHYSKILPRLTKRYLGVFNDRGMVGVVTLGWGTQPLQTIKKIFPNEDMTTEKYFEIGKMCFLPMINNDRNSGSRIMSALIKWMQKNTNCMFLYTLADGIMGKCGYIYQASNFKYIGSFKTSVYMDRQTREKIHPRSAKNLLLENAEWENKEKLHWLTHDFCEYKSIDKINGLMFRYVYPLNKSGKQLLEKHYGDSKLKNPKEHDLSFSKRVRKGKFDSIDKPDFNMNIFNHNYQKY